MQVISNCNCDKLRDDFKFAQEIFSFRANSFILQSQLCVHNLIVCCQRKITCLCGAFKGDFVDKHSSDLFE